MMPDRRPPLPDRQPYWKPLPIPVGRRIELYDLTYPQGRWHLAWAPVAFTSPTFYAWWTSAASLEYQIYLTYRPACRYPRHHLTPIREAL